MRRAALLLCLAACTPKAPPPPPALPLYAGCAAVAEGPVCLLDDDSKLRVWLPTAPSKVVGAEQLRVEAVEGGHLVWLRGTGPALELHAPGARWRLGLGKATPDEAWAALKAQGLEARRMGEPKRAGALFEEAAKASATLSGRRLARVLQGFVAYDSGDFAAARAALDPLPDLSSTWPAGEVQREFNRSVVLTETGDFRGALAALEVAEGLSRKLKLSLLAFVRRGQAELQLHLGDYAGARAAFAGPTQRSLETGL